MTDRKTETEYWDSGYAAQAAAAPLDVGDFRNYGDRRIVETIESVGLEGKSILEVGAGNSAVLCHLAAKYAGRARFTGLDYSETGCRMLRERAAREGATVDVVLADLFDDLQALNGRFDVLFSLGVVEHFSDLPGVLAAMRRLLSPGGRTVTIIPNMAGVLGSMTRRYNRRVYDLHVPHDLESLLEGHRGAGLHVERAGYLGSTNFGVLSSCFRPGDRGWRRYVWLSRLTKALWLFESRVAELPKTRSLSPYIFAIARPEQ